MRCPRQSRLISLAETVFATAIVLAHNVYHRLPNEVPILFVVALISFRLREGHWLAHLYRRPSFWPHTWLIAVLGFAALQLKDAILDPLGRQLWHVPANVSFVVTAAHANPRTALLNLVFVWVFAAFGEEIVYRGYILRRAMEALGDSRAATAGALLFASIVFGFGHFYKGPAGILESTGSGLVLGGLFLLTRRNLWAPTLTHGINDTVAIIFSLFGW
jgi:membrane protease YdiL (CAAX protease family)